MKVIIENATGHALNILVALAENMAGADFVVKDFVNDKEFFVELLDEQGISLNNISGALWEAEINNNENHNKKTGPTAVVAAFRAYAASFLGDVVDLVPEVAKLFKDSLSEHGSNEVERGADFKNFHKSLCRRFGYTHDEKFWWRDTVSLEEFIAAKIAEGGKDLKATLAEADRRAGAAERELENCRKDISRLNLFRDKMKTQWGVHPNVSFDVVWAQALALKEGASLVSVDSPAIVIDRSSSSPRSGRWIFVQGNEGDQYIDFDKELYSIDDEGKTSIDVRLTFNKESKTAYYTISLHNNDGNTVDWEKQHNVAWDVALRMLHDAGGCDVIPPELASCQ